MQNDFRVILAKEKKSISDVYRNTGISKSTLTNLYYERTKNPELQTILKIADYLKVPVDVLINRHSVD